VQPTARPMQLVLTDPAYTERLASFLTSLGQRTIVSGPERLELDHARDESEGESARVELEIYLRVWHVLYPEAEVALS
jgi:hypothetical protein